MNVGQSDNEEVVVDKGSKQNTPKTLDGDIGKSTNRPNGNCT